MTVRNASHYKHLNNYYGLSTDTKPTHTDTGDTFQELDGEQLKYIFNGTIWELYNEDGIDATGVAVPTGASGIRGWLSGIYNVLKNTGISIVNKNASGTEIFTDSNPGSMKLTGSIPEYSWFNSEIPPTPTEPTKLAWGYNFNTTTGAVTAYGWSGTIWVEVV